MKRPMPEKSRARRAASSLLPPAEPPSQRRTSVAARDDNKAITKIIIANVRRLREERGLSQAAIAAVIGVTFQQVQKYESGVNRLPAAALVKLAIFFGVAIERFFDGLETPGVDPASFENSALARRIVQAFSQIKEQRVIDLLIDAAQGFGKLERNKHGD